MHRQAVERLEANAQVAAGTARMVLAADGVMHIEGALDLASLPAVMQADLPRASRADLAGLHRLDTAGAHYLVTRFGRDVDATFTSVSDEQLRLLKLVAERQPGPLTRARASHGFLSMLERVGRAVHANLLQARLLLGFLGEALITTLRCLLVPTRMRWTSLVHHMEQTGLDAVPIVGLLSFLVGAVVAFLGATVLADFGASVFTVELVSISFLREFGVLLTAILIAGRSGSAFTAQIGSMKGREEIDAIRTLGMDPIELLVVPRLVALWLMLPALTLVAMLLGQLGGGVVGALSLDISPTMFISRLQETTEIRHFWVGMIKAPVYATVIALIGCLEGFKVAGSAESVGTHTTSSVVQSIFWVILLDALFAVFYMELEV